MQQRLHELREEAGVQKVIAVNFRQGTIEATARQSSLLEHCFHLVDIAKALLASDLFNNPQFFSQKYLDHPRDLLQQALGDALQIYNKSFNQGQNRFSSNRRLEELQNQKKALALMMQIAEQQAASDYLEDAKKTAAAIPAAALAEGQISQDEIDIKVMIGRMVHLARQNKPQEILQRFNKFFSKGEKEIDLADLRQIIPLLAQAGFPWKACEMSHHIWDIWFRIEVLGDIALHFHTQKDSEGKTSMISLIENLLEIKTRGLKEVQSMSKKCCNEKLVELSRLYAFFGKLLSQLGETRQSSQMFEEAGDLANEISDLPSQRLAHFNISFCEAGAGNIQSLQRMFKDMKDSDLKLVEIVEAVHYLIKEGAPIKQIKGMLNMAKRVKGKIRGTLAADKATNEDLFLRVGELVKLTESLRLLEKSSELFRDPTVIKAAAKEASGKDRESLTEIIESGILNIPDDT